MSRLCVSESSPSTRVTPIKTNITALIIAATIMPDSTDPSAQLYRTQTHTHKCRKADMYVVYIHIHKQGKDTNIKNNILGSFPILYFYSWSRFA